MHKDKEEEDRFNPLRGDVPSESSFLSRWFLDINILI